MTRLRIEIPGNPWRGRINVRTGNRWSKERSDCAAYKDEVALWTRNAARAQGRLPKVQLEVWITLVVPDRRMRDVDGPVKTILDGVTQGGGWDDDKQVWVLHVRKVLRRGQRRAVLVARPLTSPDPAC